MKNKYIDFDKRELEILQKQKEGKDRREFYTDYGYASVRVMDSFMYRRGFLLRENRYVKKSEVFPSIPSATKAECILNDIQQLKTQTDLEQVAEKYHFDTVQEMTAYLKEQGFHYHSGTGTYEKAPEIPAHTSPNPDSTNITPAATPEDYYVILDFLLANREQLERLLNTDSPVPSSPITIPGQRIAKTTYISKKLCAILKDYSIMHGLPLRAIFEQATVEYLSRNGYEREVQTLLFQN